MSTNKKGLADGAHGVKVKLLLVVDNQRAKEIYCREIAGCGAEVIAVPRVFPLEEAVASQRFNGLLFDIKAKMAEIRQHKAEIYRLTTRFPSANLQVDALGGAIRIFHPGQDQQKTLQDFIKERCRVGEAQKLISSPRRSLYLPVIVWRGQGKGRPIHLATADISLDGCFLISYRPLARGTQLRLHFYQAESLGDLDAEVCRVVRWGSNRELPGMGVRFVALTEAQQDILRQLCEAR